MAAIKGGHQPHIDDGEHKAFSERLYADASVVEDQRGSDDLEAAPQKLVTGFHKYGGDELRSDRMIEKADQDLDCSRRRCASWTSILCAVDDNTIVSCSKSP